jgi:hypothetical protein
MSCDEAALGYLAIVRRLKPHVTVNNHGELNRPGAVQYADKGYVVRLAG